MACIWVVNIVGDVGELFWRLAVIAAIGKLERFVTGCISFGDNSEVDWELLGRLVRVVSYCNSFGGVVGVG